MAALTLELGFISGMSVVSLTRQTTIIQILSVVTLVGLLSGCDAYETEIKILETTVSYNQVGHSRDQWLEMYNMDGDWERLGLIFGYWNDYEGCKDIIDLLSEKNFRRKYRCVPAN